MIANYLFAIDDYLPYLFSLVLLVSIGYFKRFTSITLTAMILLVGEVFMTGIRNPLWDIVLNMDDTWGAISWYGFWLTCYLSMMTLLYYMHVWVNVTKTRDTQVIIWMLISISALTLVRYLSAISIKSDIIFYIYQFGLPAINICMGLYLLTVLIRNVFDVNISVSLRRDIH